MPIQNRKPLKIESITNTSRDYHRNKQKKKQISQKVREENKNQFTFDEELHRESAKCVLGYNPYQE